MADIDDIKKSDLNNTDSLKSLYIEAVKRGWWSNDDKGVIDFFCYAEKALHDDNQGTPEKLFYHLIKDKENQFISNSQEQAALSKLTSEQRSELIIHANNSIVVENKIDEIDLQWLDYHDYNIDVLDEYGIAVDDQNGEEERRIIYASDEALTWQELLANTALLATGEEGKKKLAEQKDSNFRKYEEDVQSKFDFFNSSMVDISYKDDISLMDISPFGIGKKARTTPIEYDLKDSRVKVTANAEYGMATIFDYDIVIYIASHLNAQMNELKRKVANGETNPKLPPRKLRAYSSEMFDHLKIDQGGKQYSSLKQKLRRLRGTYIEVDKKVEGSYRREGSFSLIGDWEILSESKSGKITELAIGIPDWIYDGVVRKTAPTLLTLVDDYMLLKSGMHKWLARIAKKSAGKNSWEWSLEQLYENSGSNQPLKHFREDLIKALEKLDDDPIPEFTFSWREEENRKLKRRGKGRPKKDLIVEIIPTGKKGRHTPSERRKQEEEKIKNRAKKRTERAKESKLSV